MAQREALTEDSFDADQLLLKPGIAQPGLEQAFDARQAAVKGVDGPVDGHQVAAVTGQHEDPEDNEKHDKKGHGGDTHHEHLTADAGPNVVLDTVN